MDRVSILITMVWCFSFGAVCSNKFPEERIEAKAHLEKICLSISMFKLYQKRFPNNDEGLYVLTYPREDSYGKTREPYLEVIEKDPWGNDYLYKSLEDDYEIWSIGPDNMANTGDDIGPNICRQIRE